jgi:DNA polymerase III epsilon subunit-like protein
MSLVNSIIVIDFETGGLKPKNNPIVEVAFQAFDLDSLKPLIEYSTFVQPYNNLVIEPQALAANGISMQQIATGIPIKQMVNELAIKFKEANSSGNARKKPILVGHNIGFDIGFLCYAFDLCKVDIGKYLDCNEDAWGNQIPKSFDTLLLAKQLWGPDPNMAKYNLGACCAQAGVELSDAHRAMNDVRGTKELFFYLTNKLRAASDGSVTKTEHQRLRNNFHFQY